MYLYHVYYEGLEVGILRGSNMGSYKNFCRPKAPIIETLHFTP